jgi:hypothetical protein
MSRIANRNEDISIACYSGKAKDFDGKPLEENLPSADYFKVLHR